MGCCEVKGMRDKFDNFIKRDKSAPLTKKPIFDSIQQRSDYYSYKSNTSHHQQFRVSRSPITRVRTLSCPRRYQTDQSFSVPVCNVIMQPQPIQTQSNNISFRGDVNQIINNLQNEQQRLFKTTSKAIMKLDDDKLNNNDKELMQEIFQKLERTSTFRSKKSSKTNLTNSLNVNSKELKQMYNQMNGQLQLLNKLVNNLDDKWNLQDSKQIKVQLKDFADKVKELGEVTINNSFIEQEKSIRSQESSFIPKNQYNQLQFSNMSDQEDSQIKQMKDIMQKYNNQESQILNQKDINKQSNTNTQQQKLSSVKMKENNNRMDQLITKLQSLNQSYKILSTK